MNLGLRTEHDVLELSSAKQTEEAPANEGITPEPRLQEAKLPPDPVEGRAVRVQTQQADVVLLHEHPPGRPEHAVHLCEHPMGIANVFKNVTGVGDLEAPACERKVVSIRQHDVQVRKADVPLGSGDLFRQALDAIHGPVTNAARHFCRQDAEAAADFQHNFTASQRQPVGECLVGEGVQGREPRLLIGLGSVDVSPLFHEYRANSHRVYGRRPQTSVSAVPSVHGMPMSAPASHTAVPTVLRKRPGCATWVTSAQPRAKNPTG